MSSLIEEAELAELVPPSEGSPRSLREQLHALRSLEADGLRGALEQLLLDLDARFAGGARLRSLFPIKVSLEALEGAEGIGRLGGEIWLALRVPARGQMQPALRALVSARDQGGGAMDYRVRVGDGLRHVMVTWDKGEAARPALVTQHKRLGAQPGRLRRVVRRMGDRMVAEEGLRIALCPLSGAFSTRFRRVEGAMRFRTDRRSPVEPSAALDDHLRGLVQLASEQRVDVLVLPELSMTEVSWVLLAELVADANLSLVVAGSTHVLGEGDGRPVNRAPVLDERGRVLWNHDKRGRFAIQARHWTGMQAKQRPPEFICADSTSVGSEGRLQEANRPGSLFHLLDTSLGRIAVMICADALDHKGFARLCEDLEVDLLLLPSMSFEVAPFFRYAERLRGVRTATLYVNAGCALNQLPAEQVVVSAFACLPWRAGAGGAPNRVAWDGRRGQLYRYRVDQPMTSAEPLLESDAFSSLPDGLGMVVDLGAFWREDFP